MVCWNLYCGHSNKINVSRTANHLNTGNLFIYIHTYTHGRSLARFNVLKPLVCDLRVYFSLLRLPNICIYVNYVYARYINAGLVFCCFDVSFVHVWGKPQECPSCLLVDKHLVSDCVPAMLKPVSRQSFMTNLSEGSRIWKCVSTAHPGVLSV